MPKLCGKISTSCRGISETTICSPISTIGLTKDNTDALQFNLRDIINSPLHEKYGV